MRSCLPVIERARPLLGTFVRVRVSGLATDAADELIGRCFAEIAEIHRLMSFQETGSDVSLLNRDAHLHPVEIDVRTYDVLRLACAVSAQSGGAFDVTVAPQLVSAGINGRPEGAPCPNPRAQWSDVQLLPGRRVRFARPLWIDLSGIAKGYAVDRSMELMASAGPAQVCVNAGGDLGVMGENLELVRLDMALDAETMMPVVELRNGCLASSGARRGSTGVHFDGITRRTAPSRFVTVLASSCAMADALTKVVMAQGSAAGPALRHFRASAIMSAGVDAWCELP